MDSFSGLYYLWRRFFFSSCLLILATTTWGSPAKSQTLQYCRGSICYADNDHAPIKMVFQGAKDRSIYISLPLKTSTVKAGRAGSRERVQTPKSLSKSQVKALTVRLGGLNRKIGALLNNCSTRLFYVSNERVKIPFTCISAEGVSQHAEFILKKLGPLIEEGKHLSNLLSTLDLPRESYKFPERFDESLKQIISVLVDLNARSTPTLSPLQAGTSHEIWPTEFKIEDTLSGTSYKTGSLLNEDYNRCDGTYVLQNGACKFGSNGAECFAASPTDANLADRSTICINQMGTIMPFMPCKAQLIEGRNCALGQVRDERCSAEQMPGNPYVTSFGSGSGYSGIYCCSSPTVGGALAPDPGVSCLRLGTEMQRYRSSRPVKTVVNQQSVLVKANDLHPNQRRDCTSGGTTPSLKNCGVSDVNPFGNGTCGLNVIFDMDAPDPVVLDYRCCSGMATYVQIIHDSEGHWKSSYQCCGADGEPSC